MGVKSTLGAPPICYGPHFSLPPVFFFIFFFFFSGKIFEKVPLSNDSFMVT